MTAPVIKMFCNGTSEKDCQNGRWVDVKQLDPKIDISGCVVRERSGIAYRFGAAIPMTPITHVFISS